MVQHSGEALAPFRLLEQTVRRTRPGPAGAFIFGHPGLRSRRFRVNIESLGRFDAVAFGRGDIAAIPSRRPSIWTGRNTDCTDSGEGEEFSQ